MLSSNDYDVIIIGAGAAGLMCASTAGKRGRKALLIEHNDKVGKKILVSGGGRCNFTNLRVDPENFISMNPHFCKSALSRFSERDFITLVEKYKIPYHEKIHGQLFCDGKSTEIIDLLINECEDAGVKIITNCKATKIVKGNQFRIETNSGSFTAESLVIATGGLSIPKIGATNFGYKIGKQFGINIIEPKPSLVPFMWNGNDLKKYSDLSGISVDSLVTCNGKSFRGNILFTHKGLSGPAILQVSNYWDKGDKVIINLLPDVELDVNINEWKIESPGAFFITLVGSILPNRLAQKFIGLTGYDKSISQFSKKDIEVVSKLFKKLEITPSRTEGFQKAEVTKGGIDTNELSSKTFACKSIDGLYFIGEVIDVTGWLGGYNFQWAWSSGYCAGQYV
jgi:predicted Rossmann fold flavoprotein